MADEFYTSDDLRRKKKRGGSGRRRIAEKNQIKDLDEFRINHLGGEDVNRGSSRGSVMSTTTSDYGKPSYISIHVHSPRSEKKQSPKREKHHSDGNDSSPCEICEENKRKKKPTKSKHDHKPIGKPESPIDDLMKHPYYHRHGTTPTTLEDPFKELLLESPNHRLDTPESKVETCGDSKCALCNYLKDSEKKKKNKKTESKPKRRNSSSSPEIFRKHHHQKSKKSHEKDKEICSDPENCQLCKLGKNYDRKQSAKHSHK